MYLLLLKRVMFQYLERKVVPSWVSLVTDKHEWITGKLPVSIRN